jgi:hypothetical protein
VGNSKLMVWYENISALRKLELKTVRKTKKEFKKEVKFVEHLLNVFLKTFDVLGDLVDTNKEFTNSENASYRIAWKLFRIVHCAFNSSLKGYYDVSMALLRIAFENHLLLTYLSENEEEAKLWFKGKTFAPTFLRKNRKWSDSMYRGMSEFIHSSFRSTLSFTKTKEGEYGGTLGVYDREQFEIAVKQILMTLWTAMVWLICIFPELVMNEEWHSFCWDGLLEITRYVRTL